MAIFILNYTQTGRDATYLISKLSTILTPLSVVPVSSSTYQADLGIDKVWIDPSLGMTVADIETKLGSTKLGNGVTCWPHLGFWAFVVPDSVFDQVSGVLNAVSAIV